MGQGFLRRAAKNWLKISFSELQLCQFLVTFCWTFVIFDGGWFQRHESLHIQKGFARGPKTTRFFRFPKKSFRIDVCFRKWSIFKSNGFFLWCSVIFGSGDCWCLKRSMVVDDTAQFLPKWSNSFRLFQEVQVNLKQFMQRFCWGKLTI